jgi:hypothetical protein
MVAARYVENNPVAAGMAGRADAWPWSSARAHVTGRPDGLTDIAALGAHVANWRAMLERGLEAADEDERITRSLRSGRPLGLTGAEGGRRADHRNRKWGQSPLRRTWGLSPFVRGEKGGLSLFSAGWAAAQVWQDLPLMLVFVPLPLTV